jgi:glutamate racemase
LEQNGNSIELASLATPLLVPMIEEGFVHDRISHDVIHEYLDNPKLKSITSLILGCTHYPLIKDEIKEYFPDAIDVMASSDVVAMELVDYLKSSGLLNNSKERNNLNKFLVSDFTESFEASSKFFFGESIHLEQYKLWE